MSELTKEHINAVVAENVRLHERSLLNQAKLEEIRIVLVFCRARLRDHPALCERITNLLKVLDL